MVDKVGGYRLTVLSIRLTCPIARNLIPLVMLHMSKQLQKLHFRKASSARLTDETYNHTQRHWPCDREAGRRRWRVEMGRMFLNEREMGVFHYNIRAYPGRIYRGFSVGPAFRTREVVNHPRRELREIKGQVNREDIGMKHRKEFIRYFLYQQWAAFIERLKEGAVKVPEELREEVAPAGLQFRLDKATCR
jgi:hypothetical protein